MIAPMQELSLNDHEVELLYASDCYTFEDVSFVGVPLTSERHSL